MVGSIFIRVQAENKKNTPGTFRLGIDPKNDLAGFFLPPGVVFAYLPGLLCGPPWPPLALPPYGLFCLAWQKHMLKLESFHDFHIFARAFTHVSSELFKLEIACFEKKLRPSEDAPFSHFLRTHTWEEPFRIIV